MLLNQVIEDGCEHSTWKRERVLQGIAIIDEYSTSDGAGAPVQEARFILAIYLQRGWGAGTVLFQGTDRPQVSPPQCL